MRFILFVFLLTINSPLFSQTEDSEINSIKEVLKMQVDAWNEGDIELYMQGYWESDSLLFIGAGGPKYGWNTTLGNYKKSYSNKEAMGKLSFQLIKIELTSKKNAFVIGKWNLKRKEDEPNGYFSLIWRKIDGEWKIIADHSSSAKN